MIADPEVVGDLLRGTLAGHDLRPRDYQDLDLPLWRQLTGVFIAGLVRHTGGPVIVPMTVLNPAYAAEVSTPLHQAGGFHHLVVHAAPAEGRDGVDGAGHASGVSGGRGRAGAGRCR